MGLKGGSNNGGGGGNVSIRSLIWAADSPTTLPCLASQIRNATRLAQKLGRDDDDYGDVWFYGWTPHWYAFSGDAGSNLVQGL